MKKLKSILATAFLALATMAITAACVKANVPLIPAVMVGFVVAFVAMTVNTFIARQNVASAITFTGPANFTDTVYEELILEIYLKNQTVAKNLVRFFPDIKGSGRIRRISATVADQAYSNTPSASGGLGVEERLIIPIKREFYDTFDYETIRNTSFSEGMSAGAANIINNDFATAALGVAAGKASRYVESRFWNAATAATQTAVAALSPGTGQTSIGAAEQAYVAAAPTYVVDGVLTKLLYNDAVTPGTYAVGTRIKVAGTTITSSNIQTEIDKVYAQLPDEIAHDTEQMSNLRFFVPMNFKKFINQYNNIVTNYKNAFVVTNGEYFYNDVKIEFVPLPSNSMILGNSMDIVWATDLISDLNAINVDKLPAPAKNFYYEIIFTIESWVFAMNQKVVYVG